MEIGRFSRNELITGISIMAVLKYCGQLEITKCLLIEPLLSYNDIFKYLSNKSSKVNSIEELILKKKLSLIDFDSRFYENLMMSVNSIMLFKNLNLISIKEDYVCLNHSEFDFLSNDLGMIALKRIKASEKLAILLQKGTASDLYLSLKISI